MTVAASSTLPARIALLARDIKLSHSIFALPFALLATFMAAAENDAARPFPGWITIGLIVLCMVLARTVAMAVNRIADAKIDAANPRTANRAVASGRLSRHFTITVALACAAAFLAATSLFWFLNDNPWPLILAPAVLAWLCGYSFAKRFTWLCHLWLGIALALSPLAAAVAVHPPFLAKPDCWLLAAMVMCWVAGFDIIYALQDVAIDRAAGLFSMPSRLGIEPALWISRLLHTAALAALVALLVLSTPLTTLFAIGIACVAALLIVEHALVIRSRERHLDMAFFTVNGVISVVLSLLGIADVLR